MRSNLRKPIVLLISVIAISLVLSGCKATSSLTIELQENTSGTLEFTLELDDQAASIIRRDAINVAQLEEIFDLEKFKQAGFNVNIEDEGLSKIAISTNFEDEQGLQDALSALAPPEIVGATLDVKKNVLFEDKDLKLEIDLTQLRDSYLESEEVRAKVLEAGIEFEEFEAIINDAFASTRLDIELISGDESARTAIITKEQEQKSIEVSSSTFRSKYVYNMLGAIASLLAAGFVIWRIRRTQGIVSYQNEKQHQP